MEMWSKSCVALSCVALSCVALASCGARTGLDLEGDGGAINASVDGGYLDGGSFDGGRLDAGQRDSGVRDGGPDSGVIDAGLFDGGAIDAGLFDGGVDDSGVIDGGVIDAGLFDGGAIDAGPPGEIRARFPWNGYATGSVHDPNALRPTLRWDASRGAEYYRVELTSECAVEGFLGCAFANPEVSETTTATRYRPAVALPVSMSAPVGRRYFWRVQSCDAADVCAAWSPVRYLDVGRMGQDFDGDGYADLAIGGMREEDSGGTRGGRVHVFMGSPAGLGASAGIILEGSQAEGRFGASVAALGDVDGDGYADLAVGAPTEAFAGVSRAGVVYVHYGGPGGIGAAPDLVVGGIREDGVLGSSVTGAGDVDGDGYADLVIGAPGSPIGLFDPPIQGEVHVHRGGSGGLSASAAFVLSEGAPEVAFGGIAISAGDVDGDGYVELAVVGGGEGHGSPPGRVYLYRGGPRGPSMVGQVEIGTSGRPLGWALGAGDVNGDGYADLVIGHGENGSDRSGRVRVYHGGQGGLGSAPVLTLEGGRFGRRFGWSVGSADVDGDGYDDLLVGGPEGGGEVLIYRGGPGGLASSADTHIVGEQPGGWLGGSVVDAGDIDGDGYDDIGIGAHLEDVGPVTPGGDGRAHVYYGSAAGLDISSHTLFEGAHENGFFGVSVASAPP